MNQGYMTTSILLIRHGETAWNAVRRLQGHIDIGLNDEGRRQAEAAARALAAEPLQAIIASDLQRALHTAQAIAARQPHAARQAVQQDAQLRERCYGVFEGMLYADIARTYPADFAAWQARDIDAVMADGERRAESFRQFYQRCTDGIAAWAGRYPCQTIAIVAHGGVLECAYRAATGMTLDSPRDFQVKNAGINRFTFKDGQLALQSWGETAHLEQAVLDDIV
jgi:probable phosphoglycerate mutase